MGAVPARRIPRRPPEERAAAPLHVVSASQPESQALGAPTFIHVRIDDFAVAVVLRQRPDLRGRAVLVGGDAHGRGPVLAASAAAREEGARPGMTLRAAEKQCPHALILPADPAQVEAAARAVLAVLGRFTPLVEPAWIAPAAGKRKAAVDLERLAGRFGATLDVHGCERLFGPPQAIAARLGTDLGAGGYAPRFGLAGNPHLAAVAAAAAEVGDPRCVPVGGEGAFLEHVPLTILEGLDPDLLERLHALGIRLAGQVARLPEPALRRRFGQAGRQAHEQARGAARRALTPAPEAAVLAVECVLEDATLDGIWLDRELTRLAERLAARLAVRGQAASLLALAVQTEGSFVRAGDAALSRTLHLKIPVARAPALLARARELFAQTAPRAPVTGLRLEASMLGGAAAQSTLPLIDRQAEHVKLEAVALALRGRFGPRAARRARLVADAVLPEERVAWDGPATLAPRHARAIAVRHDAAGRPVALRRDPRPWEPLRAVCAAWRLRANWWSAPADRHYYLVETERGSVLEIYQEQRDGSWWLAGRRD